MRIACLSDQHEHLPEIPECDVLVVAGDLTFAFKGDLVSQHRWLCGTFRPWAEKLGVPVVVIAGNHDQSIEAWGWPKDAEGLNIYYLQDEAIVLNGVKFHGTPWQPWFYSWAFNAPEIDGEKFLAEKFAAIEDDTDVVICHGPPRGYGDTLGDPADPNRGAQPRAGSQAMTDRLREIKPALMVCGHLHGGRGQYVMTHEDRTDTTMIVNAALVNEKYHPVNPVKVVNI
jgi:Icc-related predicted phosphoesterase